MRTRVPTATSASAETRTDLTRLGQALASQSTDLCNKLAARTRSSGLVFAPAVEAIFNEAAQAATDGLAQWLAGDGVGVARTAGHTAAQSFAQLAATRTVSLKEVTKRCLQWRDFVADAIYVLADSMALSVEALDEATTMLGHSGDVTLVRMCEAFEEERQRLHDEVLRQQAELAFAATHDDLTGLPNRALLLDRIEQALLRTRRTVTSVGVLFIDLDNFKSVNDVFGHSAGDDLLRAVVERFSAVLRSGSLGRLGGDEFVAVLDDIARPSDIEAACRRLLGSLEEPFMLSSLAGAPLRAQASIGAALGGHGDHSEELLRDADLAMYQAKASGRGTFVVFEPVMAHTAQARLEMELALHTASIQEQFYLEYQPVFALGNMEMIGAEALLRWAHPERGVLCASEFVPALESTGLIVPIGRWVLQTACADAAEWERSGSPVGVAVNVSARQLAADEFVGDVRHALERTGLGADRLTLEITETAVVADLVMAQERVNQLKALGVRIAIDDFGIGYSSLNHLRSFPIDVLKIDQSFVARMSEDSEGRALIHAIVELGAALGVETIAEGIESPDQLAQLQAEQCQAGQGFLLATPINAGVMRTFLAAARDNPAQLNP